MAPIRNGSSRFNLFQYGPNLPFEIIQIAIVLNDIVCQPAFFCQAHLRGDVFLGGLSAQAVALLQAALLNVDAACDQENRPQPLIQLAFEQERDLIDDHRIAGRSILRDALFCESAHARMNDRFELFSRCRIIEDDLSQMLPVESSVGAKHVRTEGLEDFAPRRLFRLDDFTRQSVGVDNGGTEARENFCHSALAGRDAAREAD